MVSDRDKRRALLAAAALFTFLQRDKVFMMLKTMHSWMSRRHFQELYACPPLEWHQDNYFRNKNGLMIHWKFFPSSASKQRGVVFFLHGYAEHSGRYGKQFANLNEAGYHVVALDHQGHGCSDGDRGNVPDVFDFVSDIVKLCDIVDAKLEQENFGEQELPRIMMGHSFGGALAILTVLQKPRYFAAMALSGPCLEPFGVTGLHWLVKLLAMLAPKLPIATVDAGACSHNADNLWRSSNDPLHYKGMVNVNTLHQLIRGGAHALEKAEKITIPTYLFGGSEDRLVVVNRWKEFINNVGVPPVEKTCEILEGLYHEVLFEEVHYPAQIDETWDCLLRFLKTSINQRHNSKNLMKKRSSACLLNLESQNASNVPLWQQT